MPKIQGNADKIYCRICSQDISGTGVCTRCDEVCENCDQKRSEHYLIVGIEVCNKSIFSGTGNLRS